MCAFLRRVLAGETLLCLSDRWGQKPTEEFQKLIEELKIPTEDFKKLTEEFIIPTEEILRAAF